MEAPSEVKQIISDLKDNEKPLLSGSLADLSNISPEDLSYWNEVWLDVEPERRRKTVSRLVELAEENFELNFDSIFKNSLKDPDPEVRAKAIEGLWENEETSLITPLIRILNEDGSEIVQTAAAKALSKYAMLAELRKLGPSSTSRVSQALLDILADKNKPVEVWRRALEAAAPLSLSEVKQAIQEAFQSSNPRLKNSAIYAMGKNCDSAWLPVVIKELSSEDAGTRYEAAGACGEICDEEAVPHLIKLIQDRDSDVQQAAILSLGKIGGSKARQFLLKCRQNPDEIISEAAEQALRHIDTEDDTFHLKYTR
ncbi:MAG: HEAT repeat domain-containing protein [Dehalococcoidales bacterium]|nr:HEAT repeat domain-containing protein [Dehalococcoidales bacterium]